MRFADSCAAEIASDFHELFRGSVRSKAMSTDALSQSSLPLEEASSDGRVFLNASVWFVDSDGYRVVFRWHEPIYRIALDDEVHLRLVAVLRCGNRNWPHAGRSALSSATVQQRKAAGNDSTASTALTAWHRKSPADVDASWTRASRALFAAGFTPDAPTARWPSGWESTKRRFAAP